MDNFQDILNSYSSIDPSLGMTQGGVSDTSALVQDATLQPIKNLKIKTNFGFTLGVDSYRSYTPAYKLSSNIMNDVSQVSQSMSSGCTLMWENTATYDFKIADKHSFTFLLGQSIEVDGLGESISGSNTNSLFNDFSCLS